MSVEIDLKFQDVFKILYHSIVTLMQVICFKLLSILLQITIVLKNMTICPLCMYLYR